MLNHHERSDLLHIMKMNRFTLSDSDTAHLAFTARFDERHYQINIHAVEVTPTIIVKQNEAVVFSDTVKSIDDLKIFLEDRLYKYIEV